MILYYFSATGNSLTTAGMLASQLEDCKLVSVASTKNMPKVVEQSDCVGFVFPVYYSDMPYPVRELISKMVFQKNAYIFICTTFKGHYGSVAQRVDQLLKTRGQKLSLSLGISMPGNSYISTKQFNEECLQKQEERVFSCIESIKNREVNVCGENNVIESSPVFYPNNFRGIMADETCIGCGTCVKVCAMKNITMQNNKAIIGDHCATCLACFHWCPVEAIYMSKQENIARREKYHHPDVSLQDIVKSIL